jgi:hypothetical protein
MLYAVLRPGKSTASSAPRFLGHVASGLCLPAFDPSAFTSSTDSTFAPNAAIRPIPGPPGPVLWSEEVCESLSEFFGDVAVIFGCVE